MATIKIERTDNFVSSVNNYRIFIDGEQVGAMAYGQIKEFTATPGQHSLIAKTGWWCSSPEIRLNVSDDETKVVQVERAKYYNWGLAILLGLIIIRLIARLGFDYTGKYSSYLIYALLFFCLYAISLGRKRYLSLTEI